ncbi:MAG: hypothetical protein ABIH46_09570, partial [Chloroflexota bacterium]
LQGSDIEQIERSSRELSDSLQKVGAAVYQQPGPTPPPDQEGPSASDRPDEGTVEGEFREV